MRVLDENHDVVNEIDGVCNFEMSAHLESLYPISAGFLREFVAIKKIDYSSFAYSIVDRQALNQEQP